MARSWEVAATLARDLANQPPVLVGLPEPNPSDAGRPLFNTAVLLHEGRVGQRFRKSLLPDLRRLRRGPLLRAVSRRADPRARRTPARHQHLRGRLERSRLLEAPPLSPRSDRRADARRRRRDRQPVGVAVLGRQAPAPRRDAEQHGAEASRAGRLRQSVRRQRRPGLRRPEPGDSTPTARRSRAAARSRPTWSSATSNEAAPSRRPPT